MRANPLANYFKGGWQVPLLISWSGQVHEFHHLVCDLNGTLAVDGKLVNGVSQRLRMLGQSLNIAILTAATHGGTETVSRDTGIVPVIIGTTEDKTQYIQSLTGGTIAIGNGNNDFGMLTAADLAIVVVGTEGAAAKLLSVADVLVYSPLDGLDLLLYPKRLTATLRA